MKNKSILIFLIFLLSSCTLINLTRKDDTKYYSIDANLTNINGYKKIDFFEIETFPPIDTNLILYKKNSEYYYYAKSKWICSPGCMLKKIILSKFNYIEENIKIKKHLKLIIYDFEPVFLDNETNNYAFIKIRGIILNSEFLPEKTKDFSYKIKIEKLTTDNVVISFNKGITKFLKDLDKWIFN